MECIVRFVDSLKTAKKQTHANMTIYPLMASDFGEPDYITLEEGLEDGDVEITEITESGSVPELKLVNRSRRRLLILDGEEIVGAKQNRIVNASFLIDPKSETVIPVSCVEQGRWTYKSRTFHSGKKVSPSSLRRGYQADVACSLSRGGEFRTDQGKVWNELDAKAGRMRSASPTGAMADLFDGQRNFLDEYINAFRTVECQVGAVFFINGRPAGLECFYHYDTFRKFFDKLVQSYALDAIDMLQAESPDLPGRQGPEALLASVRNASMTPYASVGIGENVRIGGRASGGAALAVEDRVLHLSVFPVETNGEKRNRVRLQRYSRRRNRN